MQRIRIGLTGLAGVTVLVLFAAAVLGLRSAEPGGTAARGATHAAADAPKDPLAELGVTPGGGASELPPAPRPAPTTHANLRPVPRPR